MSEFGQFALELDILGHFSHLLFCYCASFSSIPIPLIQGQPTFLMAQLFLRGIRAPDLFNGGGVLGVISIGEFSFLVCSPVPLLGSCHTGQPYGHVIPQSPSLLAMKASLWGLAQWSCAAAHSGVPCLSSKFLVGEPAGTEQLPALCWPTAQQDTFPNVMSRCGTCTAPCHHTPPILAQEGTLNG